ncbi:MAG: TSUP family transporter [Rhodobiaceae bacterium]|nr:TSUP family transporter [Rhodobiaceae bacterium]
MVSVGLTALIALTVIATATLSGIFGMAGGIVLMGVFLVVLPVSSAMMLHGATQAVSNGYRAFLTRDHIVWPVLGLYVVGAVLSLAALSAISFVPDKALVFICVGTVPFAAAALPARFALDITKPGMPMACGFIITLINLIAGVAGPLLDAFFVKSDLTRHQVVATKAVTQTLSHLLKLVYFGILVRQIAIEANGELTTLPWWLYVMGIPCAMLGTTIGTKVLDKISDTNFRKWSQWIILTLGAICITRGITLWVS